MVENQDLFAEALEFITGQKPPDYVKGLRESLSDEESFRLQEWCLNAIDKREKGRWSWMTGYSIPEAADLLVASAYDNGNVEAPNTFKALEAQVSKLTQDFHSMKKNYEDLCKVVPVQALCFALTKRNTNNKAPYGVGDIELTYRIDAESGEFWVNMLNTINQEVIDTKVWNVVKKLHAADSNLGFPELWDVLAKPE